MHTYLSIFNLEIITISLKLSFTYVILFSYCLSLCMFLGKNKRVMSATWSSTFIYIGRILVTFLCLHRGAVVSSACPKDVIVFPFNGALRTFEYERRTGKATNCRECKYGSTTMSASATTNASVAELDLVSDEV